MTSLADGFGTAEVAPDRIRPVVPELELEGRRFEHRQGKTLLPPHSPAPVGWLGIAAAGKTYSDLRQALLEMGLDDDALDRHGIRLLKVGMLFPLEPEVIREFSQGLQEILVVEEKNAFLETAIKETLYGQPGAPRVVGKRGPAGEPLLPPYGELDAEVIAQAVAARLRARGRSEPVERYLEHLQSLRSRSMSLPLASRQPFFCSGCPHNRSIVLPEGSIGSAGIITYKILYNSAIAMTGGQSSAGALSVPALARRLETEGVRRIIITTEETERYRGVARPAMPRSGIGTGSWRRRRSWQRSPALPF